jgi:C1A family cysteine protease
MENQSSFLPLSPAGRRYGLFKDNPQHPAKKLFRLVAPKGIVLPAAATTSQWMGPIRDQGDEGSCTGQMGAEIRDLLYRKLYLFEKDRIIPANAFESSASFVYKCNLIADGDLGNDVGSTIHQTFITLNQKGACLNSQEPYSDKDYSIAPTGDAYAEAMVYKGGSYHSIADLTTIKACIASGYSVGLGINVYESFESEWEKPGFMPMPKEGEQLLGGHAQHVMDYDDNIEFPDGSKGGLLVQNSWGSGWGINAPGRTDGGCYWMPYAFAESSDVSDIWMIHLGPTWK